MAYKGIYLSASVMCLSWLNVMEEIDALESIGIDYLHYDMMDGYFVPELGIPNFIMRQLSEYTKIPSDYHLMVEEPKRIIPTITPEQGAYLNIHYEGCRNLHRDLVNIRKLGFRPGLAINPATTLMHMEYVIEEVEMVTIMTVNPGFAGQSLVPQTLEKISRLQKWKKERNYDFIISVDGNVSIKNIPRMVQAGAEYLVLGTSGLFLKGKTLQESKKLLLAAIDEGIALEKCSEALARL